MYFQLVYICFKSILKYFSIWRNQQSITYYNKFNTVLSFYALITFPQPLKLSFLGPGEMAHQLITLAVL